MPNAKILSEKQAIVASLTEKFQNAAAGVIVDYRGITVAEDTELRAKMRENGVEYFVVKNTLARFAAKNAGLDELCDVLEGTTSIAICEGDPVAAAKVVAEFSKKLAAQEKFVIKSGFVDGKVISVDEVKALADLPSIPLHFESNIWAFKKGLTYEGRADQYTLAMSAKPAQ